MARKTPPAKQLTRLRAFWREAGQEWSTEDNEQMNPLQPHHPIPSNGHFCLPLLRALSSVPEPSLHPGQQGRGEAYLRPRG